MTHYEVRKFAGWHHHMLTCMLAHFFLWHVKIRMGKKSARAHGGAGKMAAGDGITPEDIYAGRRLALGEVDPAAQPQSLSCPSQTVRR
jgi:hypothetical protein